jgi:uncharacterized membrane protein
MSERNNASEAPGTRRRKFLDRTFDISITLKGLDGLAEVVGGILLLVVAPPTLNDLAVKLTQHELAQDPHDFIGNHILHAAGNLHDTQLFGAVYLLSHGLVKIVLVAALLKQKLWAYPASLVFLGAFISYQLYRMTYDPTIGMALLTAFDVFVVWLVWREYRLHQVRTRHGATSALDA